MELHTVALYALPVGLAILGFLILVLISLLRSGSKPPDTPSTWNPIKQTLDLREDPESPQTLKGRWEANPLRIHYLNKDGDKSPRLLIVLEANLSGFQPANLRRSMPEGTEASFDQEITIEQGEGNPAIWENQEVRRYVRPLLETKSRMILLREDGLGLEWLLEKDAESEEVIELLRESLQWLSHLLQQLQRIRSSTSGRKTSYPFDA